MDSVPIKSHRSKKFKSMESLWFEEERLATFVEWPVKHISYTALAAEGFYYLRTKDHCACAFCRGIIGAWEEGDTPKGEHKRHFPHCPFVLGKVTGNVPLALGNILKKLPKDPYQDVKATVLDKKSQDTCGTGKLLPNGFSLQSNKYEELSMQSLGFKEYSGPKRKDYLTAEAREKSFKLWPERVYQKPRELAEAGFYYCGLSDHVRCFHCGNGLRNWEKNDTPWVEHARWYQDCNFVLLTKGKDFIDQVLRENPPFLTTKASESNPRENTPSLSVSACTSCSLSEEEIDQLMELHIIREVIDMGFTARAAKIALKRKLMQTGLPFFTLDLAVQSILVIMDEETRTTISGSEYITSQANKMAECRLNETISPTEEFSPTRTPPSHMSEDIPPAMRAPPAGRRISENIPSSTTVLSPLPSLEGSSPPLRSSTPASHLEYINEMNAVEDTPHPPPTIPLERHSSSDSGRSSGSDFEETVATGGRPTSESQLNLLQSRTNPTEEEASSFSSSVAMEDESSPLSLLSAVELPTIRILSVSTVETVSMGEPQEVNGDYDLMVADDVIDEERAKLLTLPSSSSKSSSSSSASQSSEMSQDSGLDKDIEMDEDLRTKEPSNLNKLAMSKENVTLAQELETLRENRTCRVCMDKEMDIVFLPCTHMVTCSSCAVALSSCPICRSNIQYAFKPIIT